MTTKLGEITVGTRLAWTDCNGRPCAGVCVGVDEADAIFPWHVVDQAGVDEWIGQRNEPHAPPTAWTDERPTEPGYYWVRIGSEDAHPTIVRVAGSPPGVTWFGNSTVDDAASIDRMFPDAQWQRTEPKP